MQLRQYVLLGLFVSKARVIAIINSVVQYSKGFCSGYSGSFSESSYNHIRRGLVSSGSAQGAVRWSRSHCVRSTKLNVSFGDEVRLAERLDDEAASRGFSATRDALDVTHLDNADFLKRVSMTYCFTSRLQQPKQKARSRMQPALCKNIAWEGVAE